MTAPAVLDADPAICTSAMLTTLLEQTALGDRDSFARLYDGLSGRAFGLILRILANRALAEETLQDVFLEVWRKADTFDSTRGAAHTWVLTMAHHRAVDRVRSHSNAAEREQRAGLRDLVLDRDVVADEIDDRAEARGVRAALAGLTESQRSVLSLAYYGGYTQSEIAALTRTPLGTVKSTTRAALIRMRGILAAA